MKETCYIFGASLGGSRAVKFLEKTYHILGFLDNSIQKAGQYYEGYNVLAPSSVSLSNVDWIFVTLDMQYMAVINQLRQMGVCDSRIRIMRTYGTVESRRLHSCFQMLPPPDKSIFTDIKIDLNVARRISDDFSLNYENGKNDEDLNNKICLPQGRKKALICAFPFPPNGGSGVQRSLKFVKYLRDFGYEPVVLTAGYTDQGLRWDESLLCELPENLTVLWMQKEEILEEFLTNEQQQQIFNLYLGVMQDESWGREYLEKAKTLQRKLIPDKRIIWVNECLRQIEEYVDLSEFSVIYTTGDPFSEYLIGYYLKQKYRIPWVMDFRDPWCENEYMLRYYWKEMSDTFHLQEALEKRLCLSADAIIAVGDASRSDFKKYGLEDRFHVILNGYDETDFNGITPAKFPWFSICYNGVAKWNRNYTPILEALNELIDEGKMESGCVRLIHNGMIEGEIESQLRRHDKHAVLNLNGYISHKESLRIAMGANLLLLYGDYGEGAEIVYTGKIFEYLRMQKPILAFSGPGGVQDRLLQETGLGIAVEPDEIRKIKAFLLEHYQRWKREEPGTPCISEKITQYDRRNLTKELAEIFDEVIMAERT